jgi:hypothetical protein
MKLLPQFQTINLSRNCFSTIPRDLLDFSSLRELILDENRYVDEYDWFSFSGVPESFLRSRAVFRLPILVCVYLSRLSLSLYLFIYLYVYAKVASFSLPPSTINIYCWMIYHHAG